MLTDTIHIYLYIRPPARKHGYNIFIEQYKSTQGISPRPSIEPRARLVIYFCPKSLSYAAILTKS